MSGQTLAALSPRKGLLSRGEGGWRGP